MCKGNDCNNSISKQIFVTESNLISVLRFIYHLSDTIAYFFLKTLLCVRHTDPYLY